MTLEAALAYVALGVAGLPPPTAVDLARQGRECVFQQVAADSAGLYNPDVSTPNRAKRAHRMVRVRVPAASYDAWFPSCRRGIFLRFVVDGKPVLSLQALRVRP